MARDKKNTSILNDLDREQVEQLHQIYERLKAQFIFNGYYIIGNSVLLELKPDLPSVTASRSYNATILAISSNFKEDAINCGMTVGNYSVIAEEFEIALVEMKEKGLVVEVQQDQVEVIKLLYGAQSPEGSVEASNTPTVSGCDEGDL